MKTVGFPISHKENECRRAILPNEIKKISHPEQLYFEKGYGEIIGFSDDDYLLCGCNIEERKNILNHDIICDPKIGDADYLASLHSGQTVFGWIHATQNKNITDAITSNKLTGIAWEKMFERGRHVFWFNNELAGEAAILHAFQCFGILPYGLRVAVLGNGNTARGACRALNLLGAKVFQYNRNQEELCRSEIGYFDVIVNCILWDVKRKDHIIYKNDLQRMKRGGMIIDVSCDCCGGIESSVPTTIDCPIYSVDGILHYAVDHTPSIFYKTFSYQNSIVIYPYVDKLVMESFDDVLAKAIIIRDGIIIDQEIIDFQQGAWNH